MKTINIVCHYASIYGGNFIPSMLYFANSNREKYRILFTFPFQAKDRNWANYIISCGYKIEFIDFSDKTFKKEIKRVNKNYCVDIMYTHFLSGLRVKSVYPLNKKIKLVIHIHSDFTGGAKLNVYSKIKCFVEHKILRKDARYIFVSEEEKKKYKNKKYLYLPNALCLDRVPCQNIDLLNFKNKHQIPQNSTLFLTFGWSPFIKGVDITVASFLKSENANSRLIVVYGKDDGYKKCVEFLTKCLGGNDFLNDKQIIFIKPEDDIFSLYRLCDVFISSSRSEGFSYSILEALYFNLKVISSDISGVKWSKKYKNISFFKSEDKESLASLISQFHGFKKGSILNKELLEDYNIKKWSDVLIEQFDAIG